MKKTIKMLLPVIVGVFIAVCITGFYGVTLGKENSLGIY